MTAIALETIALAPGYQIPRIIRGGWQLAGDHGPVERSRAIADMGLFMAAGLNTVDGADIYTGVEDMYGEFNARQRDAGLPTLQVHTKCVPDYADLDHLSQADLRRSITRSLQRLRTEQLDLVQFHWWDYNRGNYLEAAAALHTLHQEGLIARIGGTNFDTAHARALIEAGIPLTSMQTQRRPDLPGHAARHAPAVLRHPGWRVPDGSLAGSARASLALGQPLAGQVPPHHRGIWRLGRVSGITACHEDHCRPPRGQAVQCGRALGVGPTRCCRRHCWRPLCRQIGQHAGSVHLCAHGG
jgi:hypothetical protein